MTELEQHYNKFNEDKRLLRRHGKVEFITTMKYIHKYLECKKLELGLVDEKQKMPFDWLDYIKDEISVQVSAQEKDRNQQIKILDIGAGTGRYSGALAAEGYDVTAVELVKYNLGILKKNYPNVTAYQGNAMKLKRFENETFDVTLLFGPMYHLYTLEDKAKALSEAKRVTKKGGLILVAYLMNEYSVLTYAFKEGHAKKCIADGRLTADFKTKAEEKDLYDYMRLEDIAAVNDLVGGLERQQMIAADGAADYMRLVLNAMDEETFQLFIQYHLSTCERPELLGASAHTVDILKVL